MQTQRLKPFLIGYVSLSIALVFLILLSVILPLREIRSRSDFVHQVTGEMVTKLARARLESVQVQQYLTDASVTGEKDGIDDAIKAKQQAHQLLAEVIKLDPLLGDDARALTQRIESLYETGLKMVAAYAESREAGNAVMKAADGFDQQALRVVELLNRLEGRINALEREAYLQQDAAINQAFWLVVVLGGLLVLISIGAGLRLYQRVFSAIGAEPGVGVALAKQLSEGDLTQVIDVDSKGDSLLANLARMRARWTDVVTGLRGQSSLMVTTSNRLGEQAQQLATNSSQQSEAAGQIAAGIDELSKNFNQVALEAGDAAVAAALSGAAATESSAAIALVRDEVQLVARTVAASATQVAQLDARVGEIGKIVEVIRGIADQTNLLALNAAIEAARAGETGRGFAVVADEVRKLAERTAGSTQSISSMIAEVNQATHDIVATIDDSVARVEAAVIHTDAAATVVAGVHEAAEQAGRKVLHIHDALEEQRASTNDITNSVQQIAQMTADNARMAVEVTSTSREIDAISLAMQREAAYFKTAAPSEEDITLF